MTADEPFRVEIHTGARADVFLSSPDADRPDWDLVQQLDRAAVCVCGEFPGALADATRLRELMAGCSAVLADLPSSAGNSHAVAHAVDVLRAAVDVGRPIAVRHDGSWTRAVSGAFTAICGAAETVPIPTERLLPPVRVGGESRAESTIECFINAACAAQQARPYAFLIGRLERDFTHARAAIRSGVEREAGIPCLWSDDGHQTNVASVRENTRLLIKHAAFVIADLTLGTESPERENPSRAHEIGMTIAYGRPLMLTSQEPRRYPYFSIGDMQMAFWSTETELHETVRDWIRVRRTGVGRRVLNYALPCVFQEYQPSIQAPRFVFDPEQRYIGPKTPVSAEV
jgi:hypothetical protein